MAVTCYRVCQFYDGSTLLYEEEYPEGGLTPTLKYTPGHPNHLPPYDEDEYELTKITYNGRTVTSSSITCPDDDFYCYYTFKLIHTYYAVLRLRGNGGALNNGPTTWEKIVSARSTSSSTVIDISCNCSFARDGFTFLGYSEDSDARVATYEKSDIYSIRTSSEDIDNPKIITLYAVWNSDKISLSVKSVTYDTITLNVDVSGLSSTNVEYALGGVAYAQDSSEKRDFYQTEYFGGPNYSTTITVERLTYATTYECQIQIFYDYGASGSIFTSTIVVTTEEKYVDAFIEDPVVQEGASTDEESKVRLKITVYSNDNGNTGRFYLKIEFIPHGVDVFIVTSPMFALNQNDEYTYAHIFTGLPGNCQYEYYITLYDANGNQLGKTCYMYGWTNELKRPYQWEWDPLIRQGITVPTTKISDTEYRAEFMTASEWLAFIENIELVADFCGYSLDATNLSNAKRGVSRGASMSPLQTNSALYLIDSMNPPEPVPTTVTSGKDRIMAAYFNGLRDSLNSVQMKEE